MVLFDKLSNVAAAFNYDLTAMLASDGTRIATAPAVSGVTFSDGLHAGGGLRCWRRRLGGVGRSFDDPTHLDRRNSRQGRDLRSSQRCRLHWLFRRRTGWTVCAVQGHPLADLKEHTFCVDSKWPR